MLLESGMTRPSGHTVHRKGASNNKALKRLQRNCPAPITRFVSADTPFDDHVRGKLSCVGLTATMKRISIYAE